MPLLILGNSVEIKLTEAGRDLVSADVAQSGVMQIATTMKAGLGGRQIVPHDASIRVDRPLVKAIAWRTTCDIASNAMATSACMALRGKMGALVRM